MLITSRSMLQELDASLLSKHQLESDNQPESRHQLKWKHHLEWKHQLEYMHQRLLNNDTTTRYNEEDGMYKKLNIFSL